MEILNKLINAYCASGAEAQITEIIKEILSPLGIEMHTDKMGNLICKTSGEEADGKKEKTAVFVPMDIPGFIVTYIEENGLVRVHPLGNPCFASASYKTVTNGKISGILYPDSADASSFDKCHVNFGFKDHREAEAMLSQGTALFFEKGLTELKNGHISCVGAGALTACAALCEAASNSKKISGKELYFVFLCQSELGARGAAPAAYGISADKALCIECYEGSEPAIKVLDKACVCDVSLTEKLEALAEKCGTPLKRYVSEDNLSSCSRVQSAGTGTKTAGILLPVKHHNTLGEICDTANIKAFSDIILSFLNHI